MSRLPIEVLKNVLEHLNNSDLKQCQLTCRYWYTPATEQLYHYIRLEQQCDAKSFMETVKEIPSLGTLVKKIRIFNFNWRDHRFIEFMIDYCPNLLFISMPEHDPPHFIQLLNAGYQGKLQHIQEIQLPQNRSDTLKYYNCATLAFCKSIKTLELRDKVQLEVGNDRSYTDDFIWLYEQLHQFITLEKLTIVQHTDQGLIGSDEIIEKVPHIKHLITTFIPIPGTLSGFVNSSIKIASTQPRPNIKTFEGHYSILDHRDSVLYLMHKFPKLQKLKLTHQSHYFIDKQFTDVPESTQPTRELMIEFLNYLCNIPSVTVECNLRGIGMDILMDVMLKNKNRFENNITLEYADWRKDVYFKDQSTTLFFEPHAYIDTMPHQEFVEKAGHLIQSLSVSGIDRVQSIMAEIEMEDKPDDITMYGRWLTHTLQFCPILKALEIVNPGKIQFDTSGIKQHLNSLEQLTIHGLQDAALLIDLCQVLPSINRLYIASDPQSRNAKSFSNITSLNIPNITLEKFVWEYGDYGWVSEGDFVFNIKVTTPMGISYFIADSQKAKPSTEECYLEAINDENKQPFLDITCKRLTDLHIIYVNLPEKIYHLDVGSLEQ